MQRPHKLSDSLSSLSSLVNCPDPKKLFSVCERKELLPIHDNTTPQKQGVVDSPEHERKKYCFSYNNNKTEQRVK